MFDGSLEDQRDRDMGSRTIQQGEGRMKSFNKALADFDREIALRERGIEKQKIEVQVLRERSKAMRDFIFQLDGGSTAKRGKLTPIKTAKKDCLPAIIRFVTDNPNTFITEIGKSINSSDTNVRYHLNRNRKLFKVFKEESGRARCVMRKKITQDTDSHQSPITAEF